MSAPNFRQISHDFFIHTGDCAQCRAVIESFYGEMPPPNPLCEEGRAILKGKTPTEKPKVKVVPVTIQKNPDDPICPRISMGGTPQIGYYLTFRGEPLDIILMLDRCTEALKEHVAQGGKTEGGLGFN